MRWFSKAAHDPPKKQHLAHTWNLGLLRGDTGTLSQSSTDDSRCRLPGRAPAPPAPPWRSLSCFIRSRLDRYLRRRPSRCHMRERLEGRSFLRLERHRLAHRRRRFEGTMWPFQGIHSVRRFLFLVCCHVNSTLDSKHGCKGGFTTPDHVHGG